MGQRLENKVALITGGTSGIGEATAELFAAEGAKVVITGRSEDKGAGIAERLGENVLYLRSDVMEEQEIEASVNFTVERFGKIDVLFNNAGGSVGEETLDQISQQQIDYAVRLLFSSVILGVRYAVPPMKANGGGVIINNSSIAAIRSGQGGPLYSALKAAVTHYTKLAGVELGPFGIRVNAISPGAVATPIFWGGSERANTLSDEENARKMAKLKRNLAIANPLSISGLAEDVAEAALYLASDAGRFVNCHDLVLDGGRTSMFHEKPEAYSS
jgi:NAD(P)-dependent dehydrogenase (short-subunit alcohol dehydrogenase family)